MDVDDLTELYSQWFCGFAGGAEGEPAYEIVQIVNAFLDGEITLEEAIEQLLELTEE